MAAIGTLAPQAITRSGLTPCYSAATVDGFYVENDGHVILHIKNTGAQINATIVTPNNAPGGYAQTDDTVVIPGTTGDQMIGPFPPHLFNDMQGRLLVQFSGATGVTVAALRLA